MNNTQITTELAYIAAIALAMITAGLGKRRLEWKPRPAEADQYAGSIHTALISDIHGNAIALEAVLADLERDPVDQVVCLGDVLQGGCQPARRVATLLRSTRLPDRARQRRRVRARRRRRRGGADRAAARRARVDEGATRRRRSRVHRDVRADARRAARRRTSSCSRSTARRARTTTSSSRTSRRTSFAACSDRRVPIFLPAATCTCNGYAATERARS